MTGMPRLLRCELASIAPNPLRTLPRGSFVRSAQRRPRARNGAQRSRASRGGASAASAGYSPVIRSSATDASGPSAIWIAPSTRRASRRAERCPCSGPTASASLGVHGHREGFLWLSDPGAASDQADAQGGRRFTGDSAWQSRVPRRSAKQMQADPDTQVAAGAPGAQVVSGSCRSAVTPAASVASDGACSTGRVAAEPQATAVLCCALCPAAHQQDGEYGREDARKAPRALFPLYAPGRVGAIASA